MLIAHYGHKLGKNKAMIVLLLSNLCQP